MASDKRNSITAGPGYGLSLCAFWHAAVRTMHSSWTNLPVSSFVSHSSLLTVKSVDLAIARDGFPSYKRKSSVFVIGAILIAEVLFKFVLLCNGLNIADNEA